MTITINFTDRTRSLLGVTSWDWDFGDDSENATEQNPTHGYVDPGVYLVSLTAGDGVNFNTVQKYVDIHASSLIPDFYYSIRSDKLTVKFVDTTYHENPIVSWAWSFGGDGSSSSQNPVHTFSGYGSYSVTLTVTDSIGTISHATKLVTLSSVIYSSWRLIVDFSDSATTGKMLIWYDYRDEPTSALTTPEEYIVSASYVVEDWPVDISISSGTLTPGVGIVRSGAFPGWAYRSASPIADAGSFGSSVYWTRTNSGGPLLDLALDSRAYDSYTHYLSGEYCADVRIATYNIGNDSPSYGWWIYGSFQAACSEFEVLKFYNASFSGGSGVTVYVRAMSMAGYYDPPGEL